MNAIASVIRAFLTVYRGCINDSVLFLINALLSRFTSGRSCVLLDDGRLGSWKRWLLMVLFTCPLTSTSTCNTSEWLINIISYAVMYVGLDVCIWSENSNEVINHISHRNFPLHYSSCNDAISWFALSSEMSLNELFLSAFYHCH